MAMSCYGRLLSSYPSGVVTVVAVVATACLIVVFTAHDIPDFSDPQMGFECRGTVLSQRTTAWENLLRATRRSGPLSTNPLEAAVPPKSVVNKNKQAPFLPVPSKKNKTKARRPQRATSALTTSIAPNSLDLSPGRSWGQVRTRSNHLDDDDGERSQRKQQQQPHPTSEAHESKSVKLNENKQWQAFHPFEVLRGWGGSKNALSNHSHFEWGESVTRSPAHSTPHKPVWNQLHLGTMDFLQTEGLQQQLPQQNQQHFYFCDQPHADYAHVIFGSTRNQSLWNVEAIHSMCRLDQVLRSSPLFPTLCQTQTDPSGNSNDQCCSSWSIGHYVALLRNRSSCFQVDQLDVIATLKIMQSCAKHYHGLQLSPNCDSRVQEGSSNHESGESCGDVPEICIQHNAVFHLFHYLADAQFLTDTSKSAHLRYASLFLPMARSTTLLPFFHSLPLDSSSVALTDNDTQVVAAEFGLKEALFNEFMLRDVLYLAVGAAAVCLMMWWYTSSGFLTLMSLLAVVLSLGIAYFVYTFVFELDFFPFMNMLAAVIVVGIGADDVFVYIQVWRCTKIDKDGSTLAKLVTDTLAHAGLSMFVTSFTTMAAFFSSFVCPVTAIRCFCLFAGLTVSVHFLLMLSWLPATVLLSEKYFSCSLAATSQVAAILPVPKPLKNLSNYLSDCARMTFDSIVPCVVIKLRYFWVTALGAVAIGAAVVVFYYPKLELPTSKEFQLFSSNQLFERYDMEFKTEFWFEKSQHVEFLAKLPLRFVWGVVAEDNGNYLDPTAKGALVWDPTFNMAAPESQEWLSKFCKDLREQPFYQTTLGPLLPNCFIETFRSWMDRRCEDSIDRKNRTPCCESSKFPFTEDVFNKCIIQAMRDLYETPTKFFLPGVAGPRFSKSTHKIQAVVVEYDSNVSYSLSYPEMHSFFLQVENWTQSQLASAPVTMKNGWFTSDLSFYDVQHSLSESTASSIMLAMGIAFAVLILTTCNLWLSFLSVFCLSSVVIVAIGCLVLLGWKLNILESVSVTVAVGLSVDFTLHYAVAYGLAGRDKDRQLAVLHSLSRMSSPIAMAAATTFAAGAAVLPSSVVAYQQIGTFVVVVMSVSWLYSTFFLPSLLRIMGPERGCTQLAYPSCLACFSSSFASCCCGSGSATHVDKTVYSYGLSESTLSTSSASCPNPPNASALVAETHELEPLTTVSRGICKTKNRPRSVSLVVAAVHQPQNQNNPQKSLGGTGVNSGGRIANASTGGRKMRKISLPSAALLVDDRPEMVDIETTENSDLIWAA